MGHSCASSPFPSPKRGLWSPQQFLQIFSDQSAWLILCLLCALCSRASCSSRLSDLTFVVCTGTVRADAALGVCRSGPVAEPQREAFYPGLSCKSPKALRSLWFLFLEGLHILPLSQRALVQPGPLAPLRAPPLVPRKAFCRLTGGAGRELLAQAGAGWRGAVQGQPGQKARHCAVSLEAWFLLSLGNSDEVKGKTGRDFHLGRLCPGPRDFSFISLQRSADCRAHLCGSAASPAIKTKLDASSFAQLTFILGQKDNLLNPTASSMRRCFLHQFCAPEGKELFKASSLTWILCDVIASRAWKSVRSNGKSLSLGRYASCSAAARCHGYVSVRASLSLSQPFFLPGSLPALAALWHRAASGCSSARAAREPLV